MLPQRQKLERINLVLVKISLANGINVLERELFFELEHRDLLPELLGKKRISRLKV